jgi:glutathione S-transferase
MLESFLSDGEYFAGDKMTIADISILATITGCKVGFNFKF